MTVIEKLDKIIELLEAIKENTTPIVHVPTVWPYVGTDMDTDSDNYDPNYVPYDITISPPYTDAGWPLPVEACTAVTKEGNPNCGCSRCRPSTDAAGGCAGCGCKNVAIYAEDGRWWCNNCYRHPKEEA
jgi:hypothetical protein